MTINHINCQKLGYYWDEGEKRWRKSSVYTDGNLTMSRAQWEAWGNDRYMVLELKVLNLGDGKQKRVYVLWSPCFPNKEKVILRDVKNKIEKTCKIT